MTNEPTQERFEPRPYCPYTQADFALYWAMVNDHIILRCEEIEYFWERYGTRH